MRSLTPPRSRLFLILACLPLVSSCGLFFSCAPYKCREAQEGRLLYAPVVAALENFREQNGTYPGSLSDLVPAFIDAIPVSHSEDGPTQLEYSLSPTAYVLSFSYSGPGINYCTYTPADNWSCDGHY